MIVDRFFRNIFGCGQREAAVLENIEHDKAQREAAQKQIEAQVRLIKRRAKEVEAAAGLIAGLRKDINK